LAASVATLQAGSRETERRRRQRSSATATRQPPSTGSRLSAFAIAARQPGDGGSVLHAELRLGDAVVMLSTPDVHVA
jgi:hypothetical protein